MKKYIYAAIAISFSFSGINVSYSQDYPSKPIEIIVPFAPGSSDVQIRALAPILTEKLGQQIVVTNREGAGGAIGVDYVSRAAADGYTLLFGGTGAMTVIPHLRQLNYALTDFAAVANITTIPLALWVRADAPYGTLEEFAEYARANPGRITIGNSGAGSTPHIAAAALESAMDIELTHVPYQGIGPAVVAMLGGTLDSYLGIPGSFVAHMNDGKMRPLGVASPERSEFLPEVPTFREAGYDVIEATRFGIVAPNGTPAEVITKVEQAVATAMQAPEFVNLMQEAYTTIEYIGPDGFFNALLEDSERYRGILLDIGLINQ